MWTALAFFVAGGVCGVVLMALLVLSGRLEREAGR